ncbi:unnamed protein product [marine sediment metagenome]|uniref:Uncharacterized protein n=1 Tax=marine sediment metagenome TaxID=412755 RepID=X1SMM9_9ZZZZ
MLKVRLSCPVCGQPMFAKSIEGHMEKVHELTGKVTLRLHPTSSYRHEPETEVGELAPPPEGEDEGRKAATATTPEAEAKAEAEAEAKAAAEAEAEAKAAAEAKAEAAAEAESQSS